MKTQNQDNKHIILKPNSIIQGIVVDKEQNANKGVVAIDEIETTLSFSADEFDLLNTILKNVQNDIFYAQANNENDYNSLNPYSTSFKELKKDLGINDNGYVQRIHNTLMSIKSKDMYLKNFTHPTRVNEYDEPIVYDAFHSSVINNIGYRNLSGEVVEKTDANSLIDIELDSVFMWLMMKPTTKHKLSSYEKFRSKMIRIHHSNISEEDIKKAYEKERIEKAKKVSYTYLNTETSRKIRSDAGKRLYEELRSRIDYQVKSKRTIKFEYFDITLIEFNKMFGWRETGMSKLNKLMGRVFDNKKTFSIKDAVESECKIENLKYESHNSDKKISFTYSIC
jgi:hypothetical protein